MTVIRPPWFLNRGRGEELRRPEISDSSLLLLHPPLSLNNYSFLSIILYRNIQIVIAFQNQLDLVGSCLNFSVYRGFCGGLVGNPEVELFHPAEEI